MPSYFKSSQPEKKRKRNSYYPHFIRKQLNKKTRLWRICRRNPNNIAAKIRYETTVNECRQLLRRHELDKERRIIESGDTGSFYKYVNKKLKRSSGIGSHRQKRFSVLNNHEKATLLNKYFASVCCVDDNQIPQFNRRVAQHVKIDGVHFTPEAVFKTMSKLKPKKSSGPDGIPTVALKNLRSPLCGPLSMIFNSLMSTGNIPTEWTSAIVTPLYKKDDASQCENYRPVSLTCSICKIMEKLIVDDLSSYLRTNKLISKSQHGFLSKRCTTTNLLDTLNDWTIAINNKKTVDSIYIDFSKAFDTVSHCKLLNKLTSYGITGNLLKWITGFLNNRTQTTRVGLSVSEPVSLTSGVVEGGCLGPLLFILYVNDVCDVIDSNATLKLYADDIKLYSIIETAQDCSNLQSNIDRLYQWAHEWQLNIAIRKCNAIRMSNANQHQTSWSYCISNHCLNNSDHVEDLGIHVNSNLKFSDHIKQICAKAKQRIGLLFKCFITRDATILTKAYTTYIRPILEYCSTVWNPICVESLVCLESVQKHFTKRIPDLPDLPYHQRCKRLNLETLELRRLKFDLHLAYKVIFGLVDVDSCYFKLQKESRTRGHNLRVIPYRFTTNIRQQFFTVRIANIWNSLPKDVSFADYNSFKRSINCVNFNKFTSF